MEKQNKEIMEEFEIQMKLHINEQLYKNGVITQEIYDYAKKRIIKQH